MRTAIYITVFIVVAVLTAFIVRLTGAPGQAKSPVVQGASKNLELNIKQEWKMPAVLKEISAIDYLDNERMISVQDEIGKIFVFNLKGEVIEKEVDFAGSGDYEGLAMVNKDAWVLRSDGKLFEVKELLGSGPKVLEHNTPLSEKYDTEGLCYDKKNNRLLIAIKSFEPEQKNYKGIYAFDLTTKRMLPEPVYKINMDDEVFDGLKSKKKGAAISPSDIAIHPLSGDIYILEGSKPKLLIMDPSGKPRLVQELSGKAFSQPEGITFTPDGKLYISNEGKKGSGNILLMESL